MAPIPVYTNSPITAAKADGVTPKTASGRTGGITSTPTPTSTYTPSTYPAAQPGAAPPLPTATGAASNSTLQPIPTTSIASASPAPPQPGSVPISGVPPPPKAGERYQPPTQTPAPAMPYPRQMAIPSPAMPHSQQQRGTSTATVASSSSSLYETRLPSTSTGAENLSHPAGYQQNVNASEFDRHQRTAQEQHVLDDSGDGMWGAAKKLAQQTGERLIAVESEVWKKINKE